LRAGDGIPLGQVPAECLPRLHSGRSNSRTIAFAVPDDDDSTLEVHVVNLKAGHRSSSHARREEQAYDGHVSPVGELPTLAGTQERLDLFLTEYRNERRLDLGRLHPLHRAPLDLIVGHEVPEELLKRPEPQGDGRRPYSLRHSVRCQEAVICSI
jgi:hypothetical protein